MADPSVAAGLKAARRIRRRVRCRRPDHRLPRAPRGLGRDDATAAAPVADVLRGASRVVVLEKASSTTPTSVPSSARAAGLGVDAVLVDPDLR